jgi:zinc protease
MVTYHVGSRNEAIGYTGSTHLLEHLMFKGSTQYNKVRDVVWVGFFLALVRSGRAADLVDEYNGAGERQEYLEGTAECWRQHQRHHLERPHQLLRAAAVRVPRGTRRRCLATIQGSRLSGEERVRWMEQEAMKIEADRMRNAFIREDDRRAEMTVVRNEFERTRADAAVDSAVA